ncbi:MAG TPA: sodium/calcium exchanger protein, partial [Ktedonobacterales bacterium]|nr:sodium/calcium exchanger protein [Ktedonobacterales bacterium]
LDTFVLVQIVAPLASEAPEFVVIALLVCAGRAQVGLQALVSSKVNQWTLLVGSIPLVYALAGGSIQGFVLDARQSEEIMLTAAQSLLAVVLVLDRRLGIIDSLVLLGLYVAQLVVITPDARMLFSFVYFGLAVLAFAGSREVRQGVLTTPARFWQQWRFALSQRER